jgi:NitT/TauT family transport system permease protein
MTAVETIGRLRSPSNRMRDRMGANLFTLALLAAWQAVSLVVPPYVLPGPWRVAQTVFHLLASPAGLFAMWASFLHVIVAMLVSFVLATVVAFIPHYFPAFRLAVDGRITPFLNSFPDLGWTMIALVCLGLGFQTIVFSLTIVLLPFVIINMREGVAALDQELLEMTESFTRNRWLIFSTTIIPLIMPFVLASLRVSFGVAWKATLSVELLAGSTGLGFLMNLARNDLNTPTIIAIIMILIAFVFLVDRFVLSPLERRFATIQK